MEEFFEKYPNTIQGLVAIGTFLSVIVSLWLAIRRPKPIIESALYIGVLGESGINKLDDFKDSNINSYKNDVL